MPIHCFAAHEPKAELKPFEYEAPALKPHQVLIEISHCGVCHSDLHLIDNDWQVSQYPLVPGHEIVGVVTEVGEAVSQLQIGERVGVGWQSDSCGTCESCQAGEENNCAKQKATCVQGYGGYADEIVVDERFAIPIPEAIASDVAAPLMCGGITVYSPLKRFVTHPGMQVGIIGIGGLGHMAVQFAKALGATVTAISHSPDKKEYAARLGADDFLLMDDVKKCVGKFDFLLSTVSSKIDTSLFIRALKPKGVLCVVGGPSEPLNIHVMELIDGRKSVCGSNIGSPSEIKSMLEVAAKHHIQPMIEKAPLKEVNQAIQKLKNNDVRFRMVLVI